MFSASHLFFVLFMFYFILWEMEYMKVFTESRDIDYNNIVLVKILNYKNTHKKKENHMNWSTLKIYGRCYFFCFITKNVYKYIFWMGIVALSLHSRAIWHPINSYPFLYLEISKKEAIIVIELSLKNFFKWGERDELCKSSQFAIATRKKSCLSFHIFALL